MGVGVGVVVEAGVGDRGWSGRGGRSYRENGSRTRKRSVPATLHSRVLPHLIISHFAQNVHIH